MVLEVAGCTAGVWLGYRLVVVLVVIVVIFIINKIIIVFIHI